MEKKYEKQIENLALSYLKKGRNFDIIHTKYGLDVLRKNKKLLDKDIYKILFLAFALHDVGYSLLDIPPQDYESIKKQKQAHAILGSQEVKNILGKKEYSALLTEDEKNVIQDLVLKHDEVENVAHYTYKDFETGRFLMSLDTLGAFIAIQKGETTFKQEDLEKYLEKETERRGKHIHPMLKGLFDEVVTNIV